MIAYWIANTLAALPAFALVFVGLGGAWALALLPRADWRDRWQVGAVASLAGPGLLTAWMFGLTVIGVPLTRESVLLGLIGLTIIGAGLAGRRRVSPVDATMEPPLTVPERLTAGLIGAALVVRWIVMMWWPFTAYDALWVYGFQGRLYALLGDIPATIGYYPPFLSLQYAFGQLMVGGIDDHAARAGLIFLHIGATGAAYTLGRRVFDRRVGLILAAGWALYPHVGEWSRAGDLEIPLTTAFTLAAAFWLPAWIAAGRGIVQRREAVIAGLALGVGLWTKPTMGAWIWGVLFMLAIVVVLARRDAKTWRARLQLACWTGAASIPLGGAWYVRNMLLGHPPIDLPPGYWQTLAARSGAEWSFPLLAIGALIAAAFVVLPRTYRPKPILIAGGAALIAAGVLPTIVTPGRMGAIEYAALACGVGAIGWTCWRAWRPAWGALADEWRSGLAAIGWAALLAMPYFVTWYWSYSYHYRLSFAIVPLMLLPTAWAIAQIAPRLKVSARRIGWAAACAIGLAGVVSAVYDPFIGWDYLLREDYPDDDARIRTGNAALMNVVDGLRVWQADHPGERLMVSAPNIDRLPFFFPLDDIRTAGAPTRLSEIEDAAYFVFGAPETGGAYGEVPPGENQVFGALGREDITRRAWGFDDGIFRHEVYELNLANRWNAPTPNAPAPGEVVIGGFARYLGHEIGGLDLWEGRRVGFKIFWQAIAPAPDDYTVLIHLLDQEGNLITAWDGPVGQSPFGDYSTRFWEAGEYLADARVLELPPDAPLGEGYRLQIGFYQRESGARLPIVIDGAAGGETLPIENRIAIVRPPG